MATIYFIGTKPRANGRYYIHTEDCPLLPSPGNRICLGTFLSPEEALEEGKKYYNNACCCQFCLGGDHKETKSSILAETYEKPDFINHVGIKITLESALFCGVN